jgi:phage terminase large subunit
LSTLDTFRAEIPRKLKPLLYPSRYKGAYGGRGGAKSHFFAERIIKRCHQRPTRVVCIREIQNSIKDSVKQLLVDKILKFGVATDFDILDQEIRCTKTGSLIIFRGMQSYNAANIKSLEAYDIAWVEEAQTLSQHSLDLLRPTLRKEGSELWFSWNPRFKTDPVDAFFRKNPPPEAVSVMINWRDNPWFPEVLRKDKDHDFATDPDKAEHIWEGAYGSGQGAILARWVHAAERSGRITDQVEYDPDGAPVEISSDIGFRDTATWWFWQPTYGGFNLIDYDQDSGLDASEWAERLQRSLAGRKLGKVWLPQDAKAKTFQSRHSSVETFLEAFGGDKVDIVPPSKKPDQIAAARSILDRCAFHKTRCEKGLDGLVAWEYEWLEDLNVFSREPLHNWASHPGDGFAYGAQVMLERAGPEPEAEKPKFWEHQTLNELWESATPRRQRI